MGYVFQPSLDAYYDRGPTTQLISFTATGIAPHGSTVRATYTVPTGRRAFLEAARSYIARDNAPTTNNVVRGVVNLNTTNIDSNAVIFTRYLDSASGANRQQNVGAVGLLVAADVVRIITEDDSVGGSNTYNQMAKLIEFDI